MKGSIFLVLSFLILKETICNDELFNEELLLRQLSSGHVYSLFQFTTSWDVNLFDEEMPSHFNLFPKSFGEIISKFGIVELHLSLTQGRWRYNKWGYPIFNAPTGIELWAWFHPDLNITSVNANWQGLVHALSGQFCSSLNFINKAVTSSPKYSFKPIGLWANNKDNDDVADADADADADTHLRYATLPRETVCTENLTPWKKLLPCSGQAGLASILNALHLYDSSYHSLAVHLRTICEGEHCESPQMEYKQTISSVFDPVHSNIRKGWSLKTLFGGKLYSACPVVSTSKVLIDVSDDIIKNSSLSPQPDEYKELKFNKNTHMFAIYDLINKDMSRGFDISVDILSHTSTVEPPCLLAHKHTTGYGEEYGGSICVITNSNPAENITVLYLDIIPYFVRVYLHTLKVEILKKNVKLDHLKFTPAYYRERPATVEFMLTLPPLSTATISIEFEKVFLEWTQHPPDSHHGYYIGSSVISAYFPDTKNSSGMFENVLLLSRMDTQMMETDRLFRRIYTEPILIPVPLPDFSMPYNVICLTCTVIAIAFGSIYNVTTRTFQVVDKTEQKTLKESIKTFLSTIFRKKEKAS